MYERNNGKEEKWRPDFIVIKEFNNPTLWWLKDFTTLVLEG